MRNTRQKIRKKLDIFRIQTPVMLKKATDRVSGIPAFEHTVAKLQRVTHKNGRGVVATSALALEPWLIVRLCEQHVIDCIDLVPRQIMVVQKGAEIMDMVRSL
jgi:hypothetical protein